jgi:hypothetical protein
MPQQFSSKRKQWNPPVKKRNEKEKGARKPLTSEQGGRQQELHHPLARQHEDRKPTFHEEPQKGVTFELEIVTIPNSTTASPFVALILARNPHPRMLSLRQVRNACWSSLHTPSDTTYRRLTFSCNANFVEFAYVCAPR